MRSRRLRIVAVDSPVAQIDHPFVVNLRYAFQDDENCFFVLDLMLGGDLRCTQPRVSLLPLSLSSTVHLDRLGRIPENVVRFWTAELSSALSYLHRQRIVHRYNSIGLHAHSI